MPENSLASPEIESPADSPQNEQAEILNETPIANVIEAPVQTEADNRTHRLEEARKSPWLTQEEAKLNGWSAKQQKLHQEWRDQNISDQTPETPGLPAVHEPLPLPSVKSERRRDRLKHHGKRLIHKLASLGKPEELKDTPQWRENIKLLKDSGEVGQVLLPYYKKALEYYPQIAKVKIVPIPSEDNRPAFARAQWQTGRHEVHMRLGEGAIESISGTLDDHPETKKHFAEMLNVQLEDLTAEQMTIFALLHELGHTEDYIHHEANRRQFDDRRNSELAAMPVPNLSGSASFWTEAVQEKIRQQWSEISAKQGVETMEELFAQQQHAHRRSGKERYADNFAATIMSIMTMEGKK